ncbi:MAG: DUF885 domain-containing protein [Gemmatimonadota bacterium]
MQRRSFLYRSAQTAAAFGILRQVSACAKPDAPANQADPGFIAIRDRYFLKTLEYNPVTSTYLGGDGYHPSLAGVNGRLRDWSAAALGLEARFYGDIQRELGTINASALSPTARIDLGVLQAQIGFLLRQNERRSYERSVDTYVAEPFRGVDWQIQQMQSFEDGTLGTVDEWQLVVRRLRAIPQYLETARANLIAGKARGNQPDHRMIERDGLRGSNDNATYFKTTLHDLARGYLGKRPFATTTLADLDTAGSSAADAYTGFAGFLTQTFDPADMADRYAAGEEEYQWRLRNCLQVNRTTAELYDYGAQQVAMYESKMFEVAEEVAREAQLGLAFGSDAERRASVRSVMTFLSHESPANDDELFRWYVQAGERAVAYGREQSMFEIPQAYRLDVIPTPPVLRSTIDAAYYPAPPFKKSGVGRFYLTPTGNDAAALKLNNRASVADTAIHEGFPGHDWHFKYMTQHAAEISNIRWLTPGAVEDSSSMWQDSMTTEGWGLYCEELMAEPVPGRIHGFYSAAELMYEIQGQLLRAARVRIDVGIHTGRMSFSEAMDYFTEHVQFHPGACGAAIDDQEARAVCDGALRAIYRYSKWPTQAITYNLGKNEILKLRQDVLQRDSAGGLRRFHERFMGMGTIPPGFFRDTLLSETDSTRAST